MRAAATGLGIGPRRWWHGLAETIHTAAFVVGFLLALGLAFAALVLVAFVIGLADSW